MLYLLRKLISAIKPKPQVFVAKGCFSPWYNSKSLIDYYVTNIDESVPCQATVTCKNVDNMNYMFGHCRNLTSLDLSNFDTSKVTNMIWMFYKCYNLTTIKGVIDMKSCKHWDEMFNYSSRLRGVKIKNPPSGFDGAGLSSSQYTIVS